MSSSLFSCERSPVEGCECQFGFVWNQGECVREEECGCFVEKIGFASQGTGRLLSLVPARWCSG